MKKVIIYNDIFGFGGHEIMTIRLANALSERYKVYFLYSNDKAHSLVSRDVHKILLPFSSKLPWAAIRSINPIDLIRLFFYCKKVRTRYSYHFSREYRDFFKGGIYF